MLVSRAFGEYSIYPNTTLFPHGLDPAQGRAGPCRLGSHDILRVGGKSAALAERRKLSGRGFFISPTPFRPAPPQDRPTGEIHGLCFNTLPVMVFTTHLDTTFYTTPTPPALMA